MKWAVQMIREVQVAVGRLLRHGEDLALELRQGLVWHRGLALALGTEPPRPKVS
jgi:hypothetical protein